MKGIEEFISNDEDYKYSNLDASFIRKQIEGVFNSHPINNRSVKMYTNGFGMDLFDESMGEEMGYYRIWIGKKVSRIVKKTGNISKSRYTDRWYKQLKIK